MAYQKTIKDEVKVKGIDLYGGHEVEITMKPAPPNTGVIFQTQWGDIPATLENARPSHYSIMLDNGEGAQILHIEHLLGTDFFYDICNMYVETRRTSSSFRFRQRYGLGATKIEVIPEFENMQGTICEAIERVGIEEQTEPRKSIRLEETITGEEPGKYLNCSLKFQPNNTEKNHVNIEVHTKYPQIGDQKIRIRREPEAYGQISEARRCMRRGHAWLPKSVLKFAAKYVMYRDFGLGTGLNEENVFVINGSKDGWMSQQRVTAEVAAHGVIDRAGALFLLEQSLEGRLEGIDIISRYSGHTSDLKILKKFKNKFIVQ